MEVDSIDNNDLVLCEQANFTGFTEVRSNSSIMKKQKYGDFEKCSYCRKFVPSAAMRLFRFDEFMQEIWNPLHIRSDPDYYQYHFCSIPCFFELYKNQLKPREHILFTQRFEDFFLNNVMLRNPNIFEEIERLKSIEKKQSAKKRTKREIF